MSSGTSTTRRDRGPSRALAVTLRAIAIAGLALSLWLLRPDGAEPTVVVLALEGFRTDLAAAVADRGNTPVLRRLLARGVTASFDAAGESSAERVWRDVLLRDVIPAAAAEGIDAVVAHLRLEESPPPEGWTVLPGPHEEPGFAGDDAGWIGAVLGDESQTPPWPYTAAAREIVRAAQRLPRGEKSPWISVPLPSGSGVFRVYRVDETRVYLTPVYLRFWPATTLVADAPGDIYYLADEPGWAGPAGEDGDEWALRHVLDAALDRARTVAAAAAGSRLVVYGEDFLSRVDCGTNCPRDAGGRLFVDRATRRAYRTLNDMLGSIEAAAAGPVVAVVLGAGGGPAWYREVVSGKDRPLGVAVVSGDGATEGVVETASLEDVEATLRYLLELPEPECGDVLPPLVTAYRRAQAKRPCPAGQAEAWQPLDLRGLLEAGQSLDGD